MHQIEAFEKIVLIINDLKFLEQFNEIIEKNLKYVKGDEADCSEMGEIFAKIPLNENISNIISSNLKNIKYTNRVKGVIISLKKIYDLVLRVKDLSFDMENTLKSIDFSVLENLKDDLDKETRKVFDDMKTVYDLIDGYLPKLDADDGLGEIDKILGEISQLCKNEIIRSLSNIIIDKVSVIDKSIINKLVDKIIKK